MYVYNTNITKYCARNLNAGTGSILNIQEMTKTFLVKIFLVIYRICVKNRKKQKR